MPFDIVMESEIIGNCLNGFNIKKGKIHNTALDSRKILPTAMTIENKMV
jgi:hypothetical protein